MILDLVKWECARGARSLPKGHEEKSFWVTKVENKVSLDVSPGAHNFPLRTLLYDFGPRIGPLVHRTLDILGCAVQGDYVHRIEHRK